MRINTPNFLYFASFYVLAFCMIVWIIKKSNKTTEEINIWDLVQFLAFYFGIMGINLFYGLYRCQPKLMARLLNYL